MKKVTNLSLIEFATNAYHRRDLFIPWTSFTFVDAHAPWWLRQDYVIAPQNFNASLIYKACEKIKKAQYKNHKHIKSRVNVNDAIDPTIDKKGWTVDYLYRFVLDTGNLYRPFKEGFGVAYQLIEIDSVQFISISITTFIRLA